jgi:nickel superoxide dismutase
VSILSRLVRPGRVAHAHCDAPCGVYDPASSRIAAEAVLSLSKKLQALPESDDLATINTRTRYIQIKESQAEIAKHELNVLWTDYFKPEHLQQYPDLGDKFWKAAKLCSKNKQEVNVDAGEQLLQAIEEIHKIFWATKGREVPFYRAS